MKIIKFIMLVGLVLSLSACTESKENEVTFEEQIKKELDKNLNNGYDVIIDYDLKDDYVFVFYRETAIGTLSVSVLKQNKEGLNLILSESLFAGTMVVGNGETPYITVVQTEDSTIEQVEVKGVPARYVSYIDSPVEGVTLAKSYWVSYNYTEPTIEDIVIMNK